MCNYLNINDLQRGARGQVASRPGRGCDPEKFFCIFFRINGLRHFVNSKIWLKNGLI